MFIYILYIFKKFDCEKNCFMCIQELSFLVLCVYMSCLFLMSGPFSGVRTNVLCNFFSSFFCGFSYIDGFNYVNFQGYEIFSRL